MKTLPHNAAFTLMELMVASALSVLVTAFVLTALVKSLGLWRDGLERMRLSQQSRIMRERVLHGLNGQYGLRHAQRATLNWVSNDISFNDAGSALTISWHSNLPAVFMDDAGSYPIVRGGAFVDKVAIAATGNIISIDLVLAVTNGPKKNAQPQQIRAYLLNE